jgi:hypothetical protein
VGFSPDRAPSFVRRLTVSRPRVSNDNAYAESLFRTCKYRPYYPSKPFGSLEEAQVWTQKFVHRYNQAHKHSGLKFVTPDQRHNGQDAVLLARREQVIVMPEPAASHAPSTLRCIVSSWSFDTSVLLGHSCLQFTAPRYDRCRHGFCATKPQGGRSAAFIPHKFKRAMSGNAPDYDGPAN